MITNYLLPGDRVEMCALERRLPSTNTSETKGQTTPKQEGTQKKIISLANGAKTYSTQVVELLSDEKVELLMPMEKTKLILLPVDGEYELVFYTSHGLFQCHARIVDRYKSSNIYMLACEFTTQLRKHQRREYYRLPTILDLRTRVLEHEEVERASQMKVYVLDEKSALDMGTMLDISGGGCRFTLHSFYEENSLSYITFILPCKRGQKRYEIIGRILRCTPVANKEGSFEHRVQFVHINNDDREEIIHYIFEAERLSRKHAKT